MSGGIYLIQGDYHLVAMNERPYDSEALLQELLDKYPNLLGLDRPDDAVGPDWLIVKRTGSIPTEDIRIERWSLNHLFLDRKGIPTLVEVQPDDEDDIRKETIGQMLDYAANAAVYWPVESIVEQFEINCRRQNRDPEQVFEDFLGTDIDEREFWQRVKTNLQAGKIRLIFVANRIPPEVQRVVEFLNKQMDPAEVLAVEIKQYISPEHGMKTLVSRAIGQTVEARQKKSSTTRERRRRWEENSFFSEYLARYGEDEAALVREIYDWVNEIPHLHLQWATGDTYGGFGARFTTANGLTELFFVGIDGTIQIVSDVYAALSPFDEEEEWNELRNRLSSIGLALPIDPSEKRLPNIHLSTLPNEEALEPVLSTFDWIIARVREETV
ncbi:hypothetical protein [Spirulina sp. 06S082]|uniref:hypothetical protein n=1 Tax=Spirulina sp. 06S082 TaxID=3110248 RepID=UPI002B1F08D6|nr:hypothetical protein [Spirulina sp. 06S082]MEA5470027.1 hypothetical protein [Spirulina sp. 06S082]